MQTKAACLIAAVCRGVHINGVLRLVARIFCNVINCVRCVAACIGQARILFRSITIAGIIAVVAGCKPCTCRQQNCSSTIFKVFHFPGFKRLRPLYRAGVSLRRGLLSALLFATPAARAERFPDPYRRPVPFHTPFALHLRQIRYC